MDHPKLKKELSLSLNIKVYNQTLGLEEGLPPAKVFSELPSLRSFIGNKKSRATLAKRAQSTLSTRKIMAEAQEQSRIKRVLKHKSRKMKNHIYSTDDKVHVWREKIVNNLISELIRSFTVLKDYELTKIVASDRKMFNQGIIFISVETIQLTTVGAARCCR